MTTPPSPLEFDAPLSFLIENHNLYPNVLVDAIGPAGQPVLTALQRWAALCPAASRHILWSATSDTIPHIAITCGNEQSDRMREQVEHWRARGVWALGLLPYDRQRAATGAIFVHPNSAGPTQRDDTVFLLARAAKGLLQSIFADSMVGIDLADIREVLPSQTAVHYFPADHGVVELAAINRLARRVIASGRGGLIVTAAPNTRCPDIERLSTAIDALGPPGANYAIHASLKHRDTVPEADLYIAER